MNYSVLKKLNLAFIFACCVSAHCFAQETLAEVKSINLTEALELGFQNNRQLKMANTDAAIANENVSQAKVARWPRVAVNAGYTHIGNPKLYEGFYEENILTVDYFSHQTFANLVSSVPIYAGGVVKNKIEQQKIIQQMQGAMVKMTESEVKMTVTEQYFTLEKLYRQIEVTKQNIINTELRINQLKSRVANGQNLKSDLLRTELQLSYFKVSVFESTNDIALISNYLDILIGLPTNTILKPEDSQIIPTENIDLQNSLAEAYQNREEIKRAEMDVKLSESTLSITRSGFKPNLDASIILNTEYPAQWPDYVNIVNYWAAGLSLSWDVSSFYNLKHRVKGDKYQIDKSNIALDATKDQIGTEVKNAVIKYAESKENIKTYKKDVELSLSNYKIVKSRYENDYALITEMVDAELQLNKSKISLVNADIDLMIQYYSLQYAMGKL